MALVVPNVAEVDLLQVWLNRALVLKLFSNNVVPAEGDTISTYIEVSGGGYAAKNLVFANWVITPGDPTIASYPDQDFAFTGATNPPGTIYGYYVVVGSTVLWAERFPEAVLPFSPQNGSLVRVALRLQVS